MENMQLKTSTSDYYKKMLTLGFPIVLQQLVSTSLNMIDTIMISMRGDVAIAAVGIANKYLFIMIVTLFGVFSGTSIFFAQFWGVNDKKSIHKLLGLSISLGSFLALIFTILALIFPAKIITSFIDDPIVIDKGATYLKIVCISYIPMAISFAVSNASRNVHKTVTPMISSVIGLLLNTCLNYLLINGHFGFPELGVKGAAIATLIARFFELLLLILIIYIEKNNPLKSNIRELFIIDWPLYKRVLIKIIPVTLNEASWVVGTTLYFVAFGRLGTSSVAAVQIANTVLDYSWAIFFGIGGAAAIQIGNEIGKQNYNLSYLYAKKSLTIGVILSVIIGTVLVLASPFIVSIFNLTGNTAKLSIGCILTMSLFLPIRQFNYVMFISVLRSGGDAVFCMLTDGLSIWLIGLPLTFLFVIFTDLPIPIVLGISYFEEIIKAFVVYHRFKTKKWINNLVN